MTTIEILHLTFGFFFLYKGAHATQVGLKLIYVARDDFEHLILLSLSPKCCDHRCVPSNTARLEMLKDG